MLVRRGPAASGHSRGGFFTKLGRALGFIRPQKAFMPAAGLQPHSAMVEMRAQQQLHRQAELHRPIAPNPEEIRTRSEAFVDKILAAERPENVPRYENPELQQVVNETHRLFLAAVQRGNFETAQEAREAVRRAAINIALHTKSPSEAHQLFSRIWEEVGKGTSMKEALEKWGEHLPQEERHVENATHTRATPQRL